MTPRIEQTIELRFKYNFKSFSFIKRKAFLFIVSMGDENQIRIITNYCDKSFKTLDTTSPRREVY